MKTAQLIEQRTAIVSEMRSITDVPAGAAGDLSDAQAAKFDELRSRMEALDKSIERARFVDEADRRSAGAPINGSGDADFDREARSFSIVRAMAAQAGLSGIDAGREREVSAELAKRSGVAPQGFLVPTSVFEQRVLTTALPAGGPGSNLIQTDLRGDMFINRLRASLVTGRLGATVLNGLTGNVDIPRLKASASTGWVAENTALPNSDHQFDKVSMTPKHVGALTELSRNMLQQPSIDIEQLVRNDFAAILAEAMDRAALNGSGTGAEPRGVLNVVGIGNVPMGTNGAAMTIDTAADLMGAVQQADVADNSRGFVSTPKVQTAAMKLKDGQNRPYGVAEVFKQQNVLFSNTVPSNLTKGTGTNLSATIYGNWSDLLIGYWSAFDLLVNPYESTAYAKGNVQVRAMLTADIAVRYAQSFAAARDIIA
jgi:HK97 family phage major capsid protein